ncbi:MAG: extracellular solute-binding protein [Clostridiales bacterium]|nr:extracellular solute-binding protein [Clostridiales bacterium]
MKSKKIMAVALAALMLMGSSFAIAGCNSKSNKKVVTISKDDPWYKVKEIDLDEIVGVSEYTSAYFNGIEYAGDYIIANYETYKYDPKNMLSTNETLIAIFDKEGNFVNKFGTAGLIDVDQNSYCQALGCIVENGQIYCYSAVTNWMEGSSKVYKVKIDAETGTGEAEEVDLGLENGEQISSMTVCDGYGFIFKNAQGSGYLYVIKDGEIVHEQDLKNIIQSDYIYVSNAISDGEKIKLYSFDNNGQCECEYDTKTNEFKNNGESSYYSNSGSIEGFDGKYYTVKADGVYADDDTLFCAFGDTDGNLNRLSNAKIGSVLEDKVILFGNDYDPYTYMPKPSIIILDKQDENPNAGKTLLTASAPFMMVTEMTAEGIRKFNNENDKYYIRTTSDDLFNDPDYDYQDEDFIQKYQDEFKMKVLADDGPDIIFDVNNINGLENEDCLLDLSKDITFDPDLYYTNITDSMAKDGKLFAIPLSFSVEGLLVEKECIKDGAKGFTLDEYKKLVSEACNGEDPITEMYSKESLFFYFLSSSYNTWIQDGKVNFNQDEFKAMAEYIKDNMPDNPTLMDEDGVIYYDETYMQSQMNKKARQIYLYSVSDFFREVAYMEDPEFLGFPSTDGRGPAASTQQTVGISASTASKDACVEFVKALLSPEVQKLCDTNPISKEAAESIVDEALTSLNEEYRKNVEEYGYSDEEAIMMGYSKPKDNAKEIYLNSLDKVDSVYMFDTSIETIVSEEAQAYFSGQKSVDEFIANLENRVQTVLNEQG